MSSHPSLPELVIHADWGITFNKRWMACARLNHDRHYCAGAPAVVRDSAGLLDGVREQIDSHSFAVLGFDFPIGLPRKYAEHAGIKSFRSALIEFGHNRWAEFYTPASAAGQINLYRPFYPRRPGGTLREHLTSALGLEWQDLLRVCDRKQPHRQAACALFWTLGANQVGKAAISGWREVLEPALHRNSLDLAIWPFDGPFHRLAKPSRIVIAETYPAECYFHLGLLPNASALGHQWSKRKQSDRALSGRLLAERATAMGVVLDYELSRQIADGFGTDKNGEDRFDAVVGLFGMLNVVLGHRDPGDPTDETLRAVEGWILGQAPTQMAAQENDYYNAQQRHLASLEHGIDMGTGGEIGWRREDSHER